MPRSHVKLRKRASWESASNLGHGVDPMRHVRPTTALEKYEEGCGSVTHVTVEPLKMFIGTNESAILISVEHRNKKERRISCKKGISHATVPRF